VVTKTNNREWAFLLYRLPREPSAPRISLWRALRRLGAVLVGDGLVALPVSARTIEHLEWLAAGIRDNGGEASVWIAGPTTRRDGEQLARQSRDAADDDYRAVVREADSAAGSDLDEAETRRTLRRLRRQLHAISTRDFFGAPSAAKARAAVEALASTRAKVLA
jgi:Protein ChrB, N-terminal